MFSNKSQSSVSFEITAIRHYDIRLPDINKKLLEYACRFSKIKLLKNNEKNESTEMYIHVHFCSTLYIPYFFSAKTEKMRKIVCQ